MRSEQEIHEEIEAVLRDIEESDTDFQLKSYLNIVLNTLHWVQGNLSMDDVLGVAVEESEFWGSD